MGIDHISICAKPGALEAELLIQLGFDDEGQGKTHGFRPTLPSIISCHPQIER